MPGRNLDEFAGVIVMQVVEESPAELAGLLPGDVIFSLDGTRFGKDTVFAEAIGDLEPGDNVVLGVRRAGEEESLEITVKLGTNPDEPEKAYLGVFYRQLPGLGSLGEFSRGQRGKAGEAEPRFFREDPPAPGEREAPFFFQMPHGIPFQGFPGSDENLRPFRQFTHFDGRPGAVITEVIEGSPAEAAGLSAGDLILEVDGSEVSGFAGLVDALGEFKPGEEVTLTVLQSQSDESEITLVLAAHPDDPDRAFLGVSVLQMKHLEGMEDGEGFHFGPFHFEFDFEEFLFEEMFPGGEDA
jgi:membrane-associated protease RseP (regulator of RpoE activity)